MKKIKFILAIAILFSFCTNVIIVSAQEPIVIPGQIDPNAVRPIINVKSDLEIPILNAGMTETLTLPIRNNSSSQAKNLKVSLEVEDKERFPFIIDKLNLTKDIGTLDAHGTANVTYELEVDQYAIEGTYTLTIKYSYTNIFGYDYTSSEQILVKVQNNNKPPKLVIERIITSPSKLIPGEDATVKLVLSNTGTLEARDIKVTLSGLSSEVFSLKNSTDVKYVSSIKGGKNSTVEYYITASKKLTGGNYPLQVKMEYKDAKNNSFSELSQIFIPVFKEEEEEEKKQPVELTIENVEYPEKTLAPEEDFTISFDVVNKGKELAENMKVFVTADKEIYPKSLNTIIIDSLEPGQSERVSFTLSTIPNTGTRNYPIALNVEYDDYLDGKLTRGSILRYVGVYVEKKEEEESTEDQKSIPRIIVSNYKVDPPQVSAGDNFNLSLEFLNTNKTLAVRNIKITLMSDDGTFIPANSSNTFYVENISPGERVSKEVLLTTKFDAAQKSYILGISFEYEDEKGNQHTAKEQVSIPVLQPPRLVTGEVNFPMEIFVGQSMPVSIDFYNMGKSTLYNLMVSSEGNFQILGSGYYVGNFEPGRSDYYDTTIIPNQPGEAKGSIVFTFEDASGKQIEIKKEFSMNVIEMPVYDFPDGKGREGFPPGEMPIEKKLPTPVIIGGSTALLIILLIIVLVVRRKIKVRKEMMLDE
ncbi:MAG TPA: hypothetical protein GXX20_12550 [Clostridiaceae bacterium]|nr:hypothetical protein [Clostridiaceae bacterium]